MSTTTLPTPEVRPADLAIIACMCGKPHPCPDHGRWARRTDEQLALLDVPHLPCTCGSRRGCHLHGPQPREHGVACGRCHRLTLNLDGICDRCIGCHR